MPAREHPWIAPRGARDARPGRRTRRGGGEVARLPACKRGVRSCLVSRTSRRVSSASRMMSVCRKMKACGRIIRAVE